MMATTVGRPDPEAAGNRRETVARRCRASSCTIGAFERELRRLEIERQSASVAVPAAWKVTAVRR
jgi:hypothetical protein